MPTAVRVQLAHPSRDPSHAVLRHTGECVQSRPRICGSSIPIVGTILVTTTSNPCPTPVVPIGILTQLSVAWRPTIVVAVAPSGLYLLADVGQRVVIALSHPTSRAYTALRPLTVLIVRLVLMMLILSIAITSPDSSSNSSSYPASNA